MLPLRAPRLREATEDVLVRVKCGGATGVVLTWGIVGQIPDVTGYPGFEPSSTCEGAIWLCPVKVVWRAR